MATDEEHLLNVTRRMMRRADSNPDTERGLDWDAMADGFLRLLVIAGHRYVVGPPNAGRNERRQAVQRLTRQLFAERYGYTLPMTPGQLHILREHLGPGSDPGAGGDL